MIKDVIVEKWESDTFPEAIGFYNITVIAVRKYVRKYDFDKHIAEIIQMEETKYIKHIKENFNAKEIQGEHFYKNKEDADRAVNWILDQILILKLSGEEVKLI